MKDQFVSSVSHELRTPIANIQPYLNLLDKGKPEKRAVYVETLHRESARLNKMIEDLLDISHLDMGKTELRFAAVDINRVVAHLVAERQPDASARRLTLESVLLPALKEVYADAALLTQAVSNLLSNAINFTPPGGRVLCGTAYRSTPIGNGLPLRCRMTVRASPPTNSCMWASVSIAGARRATTKCRGQA